MEMELALGIKDAIYLTVNGVTVATVWLSFRNRVKNLEDTCKLTKTVLFQEDASLNLVTVKSCETHRKVTEKSLSIINSNVIKILFHLGINPEDH